MAVDAFIDPLLKNATAGLFRCYCDVGIIHGIQNQEARTGSIFDLIFNLFNGNAFSSDVTFGSANSGSNISGSTFGGSTATPPV
ncbi:hypothetical protein GS466_12920 [Rhodococcus hoagii]|nr:hypothetical protein [Prescottella equi]